MNQLLPIVNTCIQHIVQGVVETHIFDNYYCQEIFHLLPFKIHAWNDRPDIHKRYRGKRHSSLDSPCNFCHTLQYKEPRKNIGFCLIAHKFVTSLITFIETQSLLQKNPRAFLDMDIYEILYLCQTWVDTKHNHDPTSCTYEHIYSIKGSKQTKYSMVYYSSSFYENLETIHIYFVGVS